MAGDPPRRDSMWGPVPYEMMLREHPNFVDKFEPPTYYAEDTPDAVNHPLHYGGDTVYEAIKVIEAWGLDFYLGNAAKYICRAGKKGDGDFKYIEDLEKARSYLTYAIAKKKRDIPDRLPV